MHRLTHFRLCPFSRSIRLLMAELKLETELAEELPWKPSRAFLELNPAGDLPVLELDGGPAVSGAYAISEYLAETVDGHLYERSAAPVIPGNRIERSEVRRLIDWFHRKLYGEAISHILEERVYGGLRPGRIACTGPGAAEGRPAEPPLSHLLHLVPGRAAELARR